MKNIDKLKISIVYFSPMGTTLKVLNTMASIVSETFNVPKDKVKVYDLTLIENRRKPLIFNSNDLVLIGAPVFAGRVVRTFRYFMKEIQGNGAKVIPLVTYGNRDFDDALLEMNLLCQNSNFDIISTAAFVCEHSFGNGMGESRPDDSDLIKIRNFAKLSLESLDTNKRIDISSISGEFPFRTQFRKDFYKPLVPETNDMCIDCKYCSNNCPVLAIKHDNVKSTDIKKCITCYRCIRKCPKEARKIESEKFDAHLDYLAEKFTARKEPYIVV